MLKKFLSSILSVGRPTIPASDKDRLALIHTILRYRLERDTPYSEYFRRNETSPEEFSLEELMAWQEGLLVKLTEQHLDFMDSYWEVQDPDKRAEIAGEHIRAMNSLHATAFNEIGASLPVDVRVRSIEDYVALFFRHMADQPPFPFPQHLIYPCVEIVRRFYCRK